MCHCVSQPWESWSKWSCGIGWVCVKTLQPSPQPSWHLTRWAKSASWHCARHLWWLAENIFTTCLWSRSHPALASFSPCTTKDWFILWFAACQRFTGPLSPRFSGMFDMPLLANSIPKYDNHGTIHLDYRNQIATLKQLFLNIFEQKSSHLQIHHFFLIIHPDPSLSCWFLTISHFIFTAMCQDSPFASLDPATCRDPWWYQDLILGETKIKIKAAHLDTDCQVYFFSFAINYVGRLAGPAPTGWTQCWYRDLFCEVAKLKIR